MSAGIVILIKLLVLGTPFVGTCISFYCLVRGKVKRKDIVYVVIHFILTGLGITVGFHRYLAHRSFEPTTPTKSALLILGSMAWQGSALFWGATHRKHHEDTEGPGDPHSPWYGFANTWLAQLWGFLYAHFLWLLKPDEVDQDRYVPDLQKDPVIVTINRLSPLWSFLSIAIPVLILGKKRGTLCALTAIWCVHNVTWAVNSVCHFWGYRSFKTNDRSTNNWIVGILGLGEGWHNNHHAFPSSYAQGLEWWEFDLSANVISGLEALGYVRDVKPRPTPEQLARKRIAV